MVCGGQRSAVQPSSIPREQLAYNKFIRYQYAGPVKLRSARPHFVYEYDLRYMNHALLYLSVWHSFELI